MKKEGEEKRLMNMTRIDGRKKGGLAVCALLASLGRPRTAKLANSIELRPETTKLASAKSGSRVDSSQSQPSRVPSFLVLRLGFRIAGFTLKTRTSFYIVQAEPKRWRTLPCLPKGTR